jgi:hypothetical protein
MSRFHVFLLASVIVLALSGCAGATPTGEATAGTSGAATPTPTVSQVQDPADPTTWVISAEGVGPARLGQSLTNVEAAFPGYVDVSDRNECPNTLVTFLGPAGSTMADSPLLLVADETGSLIGIAVTYAGPQTVDGIGVGSTAEAVKTAYPTAIPGSRGPTTEKNLLTVKGSPGWVSYEIADGATIRQVDVMSGALPPYEFCG